MLDVRVAFLETNRRCPSLASSAFSHLDPPTCTQAVQMRVVLIFVPTNSDQWISSTGSWQLIERIKTVLYDLGRQSPVWDLRAKYQYSCSRSKPTRVNWWVMTDSLLNPYASVVCTEHRAHRTRRRCLSFHQCAKDQEAPPSVPFNPKQGIAERGCLLGLHI